MAIFSVFVPINIFIYFISFIHPSRLGRSFTIPELVLSTSGLSQYFDFRYLSTLMWFIPFVIQIYVFLPFIDWVVQKVKPAIVVLSSFALSYALITLVFSYTPTSALVICRNWSPLFRMPEVVIGVIFGRRVLCRTNSRPGIACLLLYIAISLMISLMATRYSNTLAYILSLPWNGFVMTIVIVASALFLLCLPTYLTGQLPLRPLGQASFPFFLAHGVPMLYIYVRFGSVIFPWATLFLLCWAGSVLLIVTLGRIPGAIATAKRVFS